MHEVLGALAKLAGKIGAKEIAKDVAVQAGKQALKQGAEEAGEQGLKAALKTGLKTAGREAGQLATQSLKDKALGLGMGALNAISGGEDEEDDSWSAKLGNWGATAGNIAGDIAGGAVGAIGGAGVGAIPAGLAGGAAGGWLGRFTGKALGSLLDKFTSGKKGQAVSDFAKMLMASGPEKQVIMGALKNYVAKNPKLNAGMLDSLFSAVKNKVPSKYDDVLDYASDELEDLT